MKPVRFIQPGHLALCRLGRQQQGTAVTEFGLIAPVFMVFMIGVYDITHMAYARSVFSGAVETAAREASLETGDTAEADAFVLDAIQPVVPGVVVETERESYFDFADIDRPEPWTDNLGKDEDGEWIDYAGFENGTCDYGESFVDKNRSGEWEADGGAEGNGGAGDVVIYTARATYTPLFKIPFAPDSWNERTMTARAVKKNQPFGDQVAGAGTCPV